MHTVSKILKIANSFHYYNDRQQVLKRAKFARFVPFGMSCGGPVSLGGGSDDYAPKYQLWECCLCFRCPFASYGDLCSIEKVFLKLDTHGTMTN